MYKIANKAHKPMTKTDAFAKSGNFNFSSVTTLWNSIFSFLQDV
jgi:hypothetical protein